jgi:hypothetical protein
MRAAPLGALLALLAATAFSIGAAYAADDRPPGGNFSDRVVRAVDVAEPAIVRIATIYSATVSISNLCGRSVTLPSSGSYVAGGTGSGAFISSNGDILTADHVVEIPKADLDSEILGDPQSPAAQDAADAYNRACGPSTPVSATDVADAFAANNFPAQISYSDQQRLVWQDTSFTGPTSSGASSSFLEGLTSAPHKSATVVGSSAFDQNDLAILHIDLADTPSIQLDSSASVAVQDQLTIIGFPGNGDVSTSANDLFTPSVNVITVSAIKTGDNGAKLIQVGGNVEHGDSGGPALDAAGHIVGVVSFGGADTQGSTAFLRSSDDALSLIASAGVSVQPGAFQIGWQQAFADYASTAGGHWHKAAHELDSLAARYPEFKGIQPYRDYADRAALTESVPVNTTSLAIFIGAAAAVLLLIVGMIVLLVARGRRRRPQLVGVPAGGQGMYYASGYPPYGYPTGGYGGYGGYGSYGPPSTYGGYGQPNGYPQPQLPPGGAPTSPTGPYPPMLGTGGYPGSDPTSSAGFQRPVGTEMVSSTPPDPYMSSNQSPMYPSQVQTPPRDAWMSGPAWPQASIPSWEPAPSQATCANGHPMAPNEIYCAQCGARRAPTFPDMPPAT